MARLTRVAWAGETAVIAARLRTDDGNQNPTASMLRRLLSGDHAKYLLLITLAAIWGSSFLFIEIGIATVPPLTLVAGRLLLAAIALTLLIRARGQRLPMDLASWGGFLLLALVGNLVPFSLIGWGQLSVDSGLTAILMAVAPLIAAVLAHVWTGDERLTLRRVTGILIGLGGVVVLIGPDALGGLGDQAVAQFAIASAAACYATASVFARRLGHLSPTVASAGVMITASLLAVPIALVVDAPWTVSPSAASLMSIVVLGLVTTATANVLLYRTIHLAGATFVSLVNFLVPLVGVVLGAVILGERLGPSAFVALALILAALGLVRSAAARRASLRSDP